MTIFKCLITFGLCAITLNTYAEYDKQIKIGLGTLSLAKKNSNEDDSVWTLKLDNKLLREVEGSEFGPYFMGVLGNGKASHDGGNYKPAIVDSGSEVMAVVVDHALVNDGYSNIFVVFIKNDGTFKYLDLNLPDPEGGLGTIVSKASVQGKRLIIDSDDFEKPLIYESGKLIGRAIPNRYKNLDMAEKAFYCNEKERSSCPNFFEVYQHDSEFRKKLLASFKKSGLSYPEAVNSGQGRTSGAMIPVVIGGESYILGHASDVGEAKFIKVIYSLNRKRAVGNYGKWFGRPTKKEKQVLNDDRFYSDKIDSEPVPITVK